MDLLAQKLTELMVDEIRPLQLTRSVAESLAHKSERWQRIALQALKQCGSPRSPRFTKPVSLEEFIQAAPPEAVKLITWEHEQERSLCQILPTICPAEVWAILGPEGGLTNLEVEAAISYGFTPCRLTANTLRSETAAVVLGGVLRCFWPY